MRDFGLEYDFAKINAHTTDLWTPISFGSISLPEWLLIYFISPITSIIVSYLHILTANGKNDVTPT